MSRSLPERFFAADRAFAKARRTSSFRRESALVTYFGYFHGQSIDEHEKPRRH